MSECMLSERDSVCVSECILADRVETDGFTPQPYLFSFVCEGSCSLLGVHYLCETRGGLASTP